MNIVDWLKKGFDNIGTVCAKYINDDNEIEYLPIFYIAGSQTLPPPLEQSEEEELIKKLSESELADVLYEYGDIKKSHMFAKILNANKEPL